VATSRHITGGGVDLVDVAWADGTLTGRSRVVGGDPYAVYLTEPAGWTLIDLACGGAAPLPIERQPDVVKTGCRAEASGTITWKARYRRLAI